MNIQTSSHTIKRYWYISVVHSIDSSTTRSSLTHRSYRPTSPLIIHSNEACLVRFEVSTAVTMMIIISQKMIIIKLVFGHWGAQQCGHDFWSFEKTVIPYRCVYPAPSVFRCDQQMLFLHVIFITAINWLLYCNSQFVYLAVRPLILRIGSCEDCNESSGFMNAVNFSTSRATIRFSRTPQLGLSPVMGPTESLSIIISFSHWVNNGPIKTNKLCVKYCARLFSMNTKPVRWTEITGEQYRTNKWKISDVFF
jgi:hypothetical protein